MHRHVIARMFNAFTLHPFDFFGRKPVTRNHLNGCFSPAAFLNRANRQNAILINRERDIDLRNTCRHRRNTAQIKHAKRSTVLCQFALALQDVNPYVRLPIFRRRKMLVRFRRNRAVAHDEFRHRAANRLDTKRERNDVEEKQILATSPDNRRLHRCTERDDAIRIERCVRLFLEETRDRGTHRCQACRTANEDDAINLGHRRLSVLQRAATGSECSLDERRRSACEFFGGQREFNVASTTRSAFNDRRSIDKRNFRAFRSRYEFGALCRGCRRDAPRGNPQTHDRAIDVVTTECGIARRREHLKAIGT